MNERPVFARMGEDIEVRLEPDESTVKMEWPGGIRLFADAGRTGCAAVPWLHYAQAANAAMRLGGRVTIDGRPVVVREHDESSCPACG